jgi:hypothetical protein
VILVGDHKLLTAERGNTHQGFFAYENGWQTAKRPGPHDPTGGDGEWQQPGQPGFPAQSCGKVKYAACKGTHCTFGPLQWNQTLAEGLQPCLFDLSSDPREQHDLSAIKPALLSQLWAALNTSLYGYFHSRTPAALLGPCNMACARSHWAALSGGANKGGPGCGVPGCSAAPPSPPGPTPPGPEPHFTPVNSSNCTWVEGAAYDRRVSKGAVTHANDREECCRHCYENPACIVAAFHETRDPKGTCFLHYSLAGQHRGQTGVVGCVTSRAKAVGSDERRALAEALAWPPLDWQSKMDWVGGNRHPDWLR